MFSTLDSQPQEWLVNNPAALHTLCICCFRDSAHARQWIHTLVPRNQHGHLLKWSSGGRRIRTAKRRAEFMDAMERNYEDIDFRVHCISSTEGQISNFTQAFYLQNLQNISQDTDSRGRNNLVFKLSDDKHISLPVLQAAKLVWIYYVLKYMIDVHKLEGFIYSDWFACDSIDVEYPAVGVSMVNFLLKSTGLQLQLSIPRSPQSSEADLLSDWLSGWCNSSRSAVPKDEAAELFEALTQRGPEKVEAIYFGCNLEVGTQT